MEDSSKSEDTTPEVDLVALVRAGGVELLEEESCYVGICPFHEGSSQSLTITGSTWSCQSCESNGKALEWVVGLYGVSNRHAKELLRAGVTPLTKPVKVGSIRHLPSPLDPDCTCPQIQYK